MRKKCRIINRNWEIKIRVMEGVVYVRDGIFRVRLFCSKFVFIYFGKGRYFVFFFYFRYSFYEFCSVGR